ncbi:MAG: hypothetical protein HY928_12410, partial [Elusimicrobia bacterium]|nr:hypothetical protein [Elusimicrobiota bacterium]
NGDGSLAPWQTGNSLPVALQDTDGVAVIAQGAYLFVIGGYQSDRVYSASIGADGAPGTWTLLSTRLPKVLRQAKAVALGERIYLMGGMTSDALSSNLKDTYIGQVLPGGDVTTWVRGPDLPVATSFAAAAGADGMILYGGGFLPDNSITDRTFTARGEGAGLSAWEEGPLAPYPAYRPGIAAENGRFFWSGGQRQGGAISNGLFAAAVNFGGVALATATADAFGLPEGPHTARAQAADRAGNTAFSSATFYVDLTPPDTQLVVAAASRTFNGDLYVLGVPTVSFSVTDGPAGAASGLGQTLFAVDAGTEAPAGDFVTLPAGWSTVHFRSVDAVGNAELLKSSTVKLDAAPPAAVTDLSGTAESSVSARFAWTHTGDDAALGDIVDAELRLDIRADAGAFSAASARVVLASGALAQGAALSFTLGDLLPGTPYRAAVFARDTAGNWSPASNEAAVQTFFIAQSTNAVAQLYSSDPAASVTIVSTVTESQAYTVALASGLQPVTEFYELSALITPESPARLVFYLDAGTGFELGSLFIYTYDIASGTWISVPIENQEAVLLADGRIQVSGDLLHASLYAVMVRDTSPPLTVFSVLGSSAVFEGRLFAVGGSSGVLSAQDQAPLGGVASGVAATLYRGGTGPETAYNEPFTLSGGDLEFFFHSTDFSGNTEAERRAAVFVDGSAPLLAASADIPAGTLTITAEDSGSGLGSVSVLLDGAPALVEFTPGAVSVSTTVTLAPGNHVLHAAAADRLGQASSIDRTYASDAVPPAVAFAFPRADELGLCRLAQGPVSVRGTVFDANIAAWDLSQGAVSLGSGNSNIDGLLGVFDATGKTGPFTLVLSASDSAGQTTSASLDLYAGQPGKTLALGGKKALNKPRGVAWAPNRIYVADTGSDLVRVYDASGNLISSFGDKRRSLKLNKPSGLAVDPSGNIFVADANNKRVAKLSPAGFLLQEFGGKRFLEKPVAVALVPGKILVADAQAGEVVVFSDSGTLLRRLALPLVAEGTYDD